jgi:DeoR/GlpR family transcriptional regulator of sugar metabolism
MGGRQRSILETLGHAGHVEVAKLAELFDVSSVTIRKDLQALEARNLLRRVRGGAVPVRGAKYDFKMVDAQNAAQTAMAGAAVRLIEEHDVLLLDAGNTVFALAQLLPRHFRDLTVISNSVPVIALLSQHSPFTLLGLGGNVHGFSMALVGPITVRQLADLQATRMFFSATSATADRGLWIPDVVEAETKAAMLKAARERIAMVEASKFDTASLAPFAQWREVDRLITDRALPDSWTDRLREQEVRVTTAGAAA